MNSHLGGSPAVHPEVRPNYGSSGRTGRWRCCRRKFHTCRSAPASDLFVSARPGGGYGDPLAREPARVRDDVADGLLAAEVARDEYGVVLTSTGVLCEQETARLRSEMIDARTDPIGSG